MLELAVEAPALCQPAAAKPRRPRILVVEDEAIVARDIHLQLEDLGYEVRSGVASAAEALASIAASRPDLVLLDIELAGAMDGVALALLLRERHGPPVVFLSAYAGERMLARAKLCEPQGYLIKPFDERDLSTTVELALHKDASESRLRRLQAEQAAILDGAVEAIAVMDLRGRLVQVNPACERITGYDRATLLRMNLRALAAPPCALPSLRVGALAAVAGERREYRLARKDSSVIDVEVTVNRLPGTPARLFCFLHDITARKKAEHALQEVNEDLERRVAQRTEELQRTARDLDAFNHSVTHDLQNPVSGVRGLTELLLSKHGPSMPADARRLVEMLRRSGEQMHHIIADLAALSSIQRMAPRPAPLDLLDVVLPILAALQAQEPQRSLVFDAPPRMPICADLQLLRIVMLNLLGNAWKYSRRRDCTRITLRQHPAAEGVVVTIADNGAGFDPHHAARLFSAFQRLHGVREFEGSGIGLATVKRAVERLGGWVWAESTPDEGATFHLFLPQVQPHEHEHRSTRPGSLR